jgi:hypothetical protein
MTDDLDLHPADAREIRQLVLATIPVQPLFTSLDIRRHRQAIDQHKQRLAAENHRASAANQCLVIARTLQLFPGERVICELAVRLDEAAECRELAADLGDENAIGN